MTQHTIVLSAGSTVVIDEKTSLDDIERGEPGFFKTKHGKRETYTMYRGFLIVRHTVQFSNSRPERQTVVYLYTKDLEGHPGTLCASAGHKLSGVPHAKRLIDAIIEKNTYSYGMEL